MKILVVCAGNTCRSPAGEAAIRSAAARAGLEVEVATAELQSADLVLAMDRQTELFLLSLSASTQVQLLGSYDDSAHGAEIPDPYGADDEVYRATLDRIITAAEALVASLAD